MPIEKDKFVEVGELYEELNELADTELPLQTIYRSKGFPTHLVKRRHYNCIKHIDDISDIIENPDYIGVNPNEEDSIELIKIFDRNILIGIKLNVEENYLYVATMHELQESKLERRLHSGRLKKIT